MLNTDTALQVVKNSLPGLLVVCILQIHQATCQAHLLFCDMHLAASVVLSACGCDTASLCLTVG